MTSISRPAPRSRYWRRTSLIALALTIAGSADIAKAQIYEPGSIVEGKEIGEWLGVLYETDRGNFDIEIEQVATLSQPGPVMLLLDRPTGSTTFEVPLGAPIFVNLATTVAWHKGGFVANQSVARQHVRRNNTVLEFSIDEISFSPEDIANHVGEPSTPILYNGDPEAALSGRMVMVEPLSLGEHRITKNTRSFGNSLPLTANITVFELASDNLQLGTTYTQSFDYLGRDGTDRTALATGWTVTDKNAFNIYKRETNSDFPPPSRITEHGPHVFNAGAPDAEDRALGVYRESSSSGATIQFLAGTPSVDTRALQLDFAMEVWDKVRGSSEGSGIFDVSIDIDSGAGFTELAGLGTFKTGEVSAAEGIEYIDGNAEANRLTASEVVTSAIPADSQLRFRWKATHEGRDASREMVFGLDDVGISLAAFGDANFDGVVNFTDFLALSGNFGEAGGWHEGDFDGNGNVNFADFLILSETFGNSSVAAAAVPEPSSAWLAVMGLLGLSIRRKRGT